MLLFDAIEAGDLRTVRKWMRDGADLEQIDETSGVTPLALAAECGHAPIVRMLLRAGVDPDWGGATTPLEAATLASHVEVARLLLDAEADVNRPVADGFTPLITAAAAGDLEMARLLLDAGASLRVADDEGNTAPALAKKKGHDEIVELFERASRNGQRPRGGNLFAAIEDRDTERIAEELGRRPDLRMVSRRGLSPLAMAAETGHVSLVRQLLDAGAEVDHGGERTPLLCAAQSWHEPIARLLLEAGASLDAVSDDPPRTALAAAAANGDLDMLRLLLEAGAALEPPGARHPTTNALFTAVSSMQEQAFALLAESLTPEERKAGEDELARLVAERRKMAVDAARLTDLIHADEIIAAKRWLAGGIFDPDGFDEDGCTALMLAAANGHRDLVRMLINSGASFEVEDDPRGWTALIHAVRSAHPEAQAIVTLLASASANTNHASRDGLTPLCHTVLSHLEHQRRGVDAWIHLTEPLLYTGAEINDGPDGKSLWQFVRDLLLAPTTSSEERIELFRIHRYLERSGARVEGLGPIELLMAIEEGDAERAADLLDEVDDPAMLAGLPVLQAAARAGSWEIVHLLLEKGLDINTADAHGRTLLMQAAVDGMEPIATQLIAAGADLERVDAEGKTAGILARDAGHEELAKLLGAPKKRGRPRKAVTA